MSDEKIQTLHPNSDKVGVKIERHRYDAMRAAIEAALAGGDALTLRELQAALEAALAGRFEGSITWYMMTVKLDMEARGLLARVPGSRPQGIRLAG